MRNKVTTGIVLLVVVIAGLQLACKAKPATAGQSARANLTPEQLNQVDLIEIPNQNSPVDISPEQLARMKLMKFLGSNASISILPVRINGNAQDAASAGDLARMINDAGLCKAAPAKQSLLLKASLDEPNEMNKLLNMAREFRDYAKKNPPETDYALYADYMFTPNWEFAMVHFVVCDQQGEWVIRDLQNSHHHDYQSINPKSKQDCNKLVVKRLESWLRDQATVAAAAGPPTDPTEAQKVLDRFLGNWSWEVTTYGPESSPNEKRSTGRSSYARVLGGNFVEEMGEDSEEGLSLVLYTYDQRRECYLLWAFLSKYGGPDTPFKGKWNEATRTIEWAVTNAEGQFVTIQHHFVSDDAFESNIVARDSAGQVLWRQEFKFTRDRNPQKVSQSGVAGGTPVLDQTPEQEVLDQFLGTWSQDTAIRKAKWSPEEKRATGTYTFRRILGGKYVLQTGDDAMGITLQLLTYDAKRGCYLFWVFNSSSGGPEAPTCARWNEGRRTLEYFGFPEKDGYNRSCEARFMEDGAVVCTYGVRDAAGETLWDAEFKMTRIK